jgi:D-tyrosyl-tRNA(Tyr) deacylase
MRVVIQRVKNASVEIDGKIYSNIGIGLLVLAGFENDDDTEQLKWTAQKVSQLRIFDDENKVPNLSVMDIKGEILVVSQFTLHALTKKGNRPSYIQAARPEKAQPLYEEFVKLLKQYPDIQSVKTGVFGADMQVSLLNDGPVTIIIDSLNRA